MGNLALAPPWRKTQTSRPLESIDIVPFLQSLEAPASGNTTRNTSITVGIAHSAPPPSAKFFLQPRPPALVAPGFTPGTPLACNISISQTAAPTHCIIRARRPPPPGTQHPDTTITQL